MRKLVLFVLLIGTVLSASAQLGMKKTRVAPKSPEVIASAVTSNLAAKLTLKDDQKAKVNALVIDAVKQVRSIRTQNVDANAKKKLISALASSYKSKLKALLTKDQASKLATLKSQSTQDKTAIPQEDEAASELKEVLE